MNKIILVITCLLLTSCVLFAQEIQTYTERVLYWEPNPEPNIAGYRLYMSDISGSYDKELNFLIELPSDWELTGDYIEYPVRVDGNVGEMTTVYYVVTAINENRVESDFSNEVSIMLDLRKPLAPQLMKRFRNDRSSP